jgi:hypothetical protein
MSEEPHALGVRGRKGMVMKRLRRRKPSPAMLVAIVALVFALAGSTAAGVATISVLNKKEKKQVRNIAKDEIGKAAPGLSVASAETANRANTANTADSATNAASVGGRTVSRIFATVPLGTTNQTIATLGPFTLRGSCDGSGNVEDLVLSPSTSDTDLFAEGSGNQGPLFKEATGIGVSLDEDLPVDNDRGMSMFSAANSGGFELSGQIAYESGFDTGNPCRVHGEVIFG